MDPFHGQLIRSGQLRADEHFELKGPGVFLSEIGRRLWLQAWSAFMAEPILLCDGNSGPRWEVLDQLVQSFARCVDDPDRPLKVPLRR